MPIFEIVRIYKYTTSEFVEAESKEEALDKSHYENEEVNSDDWLYDQYIK